MSAIVNQEKCLGCGVCVGVCPVQAIRLNSNRKAQIDSGKCIECGDCVKRCPSQAIKIVQEITYPSAQRDLPQTIATASIPESKSHTSGTLRSFLQKLSEGVWKAVHPSVNTVSSSQFRSNSSLGQRGRRGKGRRYRGGR